MSISYMKEIPLTQGQVAFVDDEDYEFVSQYKWYATKHDSNWYAKTSIIAPELGKCKDGRTRQRKVKMHQLLGCKGYDHIDGNGLNNQRYNLRKVTNQQNQFNRRKIKNGSSRYKGVFWFKAMNKWCSKIMINYKQILLGYFDSEEDAAIAYNEAAKKYFGEFARLNIV